MVWLSCIPVGGDMKDVFVYFRLHVPRAVRAALVSAIKDAITPLTLAWSFAAAAFLVDRNQLNFESMLMSV